MKVIKRIRSRQSNLECNYSLNSKVESLEDGRIKTPNLKRVLQLANQGDFSSWFLPTLIPLDGRLTLPAPEDDVWTPANRPGKWPKMAQILRPWQFMWYDCNIVRTIFFVAELVATHLFHDWTRINLKTGLYSNPTGPKDEEIWDFWPEKTQSSSTFKSQSQSLQNVDINS